MCVALEDKCKRGNAVVKPQVSIEAAPATAARADEAAKAGGETQELPTGSSRHALRSFTGGRQWSHARKTYSLRFGGGLRLKRLVRALRRRGRGVRTQRATVLKRRFFGYILAKLDEATVPSSLT